jgi:phospholipid N-methyltransferase
MSDPQSNGSVAHTPKKKKFSKGPDWVLMFTKFIRHGTTIASFAPSSPFLARTIIRGIDFEQAKVIVELGSGTGPVTTELAKRIKPGTRVIAIEQDPDFCTRLREKFPHFDIVEGDAAKLDEILDERGIDFADHVISGLPMPSIPYKIREAIFEVSNRRLRPGGTYRQLTCMPWIFHRFYKSYFRELKFHFVLWNMPPAGVYICNGYIPPVRT